MRAAVERTIAQLDRGELRVASPPPEPNDENGEWTTHAWIKQAILLYFAIRGMETLEVGPFEFHDKIPLKKASPRRRARRAAGHRALRRVLRAGVIVMPGYVNIGARVGAGTMVDTWATVGSCAQIGKDVHLSGGVGIGGVLEPPGARPGHRRGRRVHRLARRHRRGRARRPRGGHRRRRRAHVVHGDPRRQRPEVVEHRGRVPARSVVIPGTRTKKFPAGEFGVPVRAHHRQAHAPAPIAR